MLRRGMFSLYHPTPLPVAVSISARSLSVGSINNFFDSKVFKMNHYSHSVDTDLKIREHKANVVAHTRKLETVLRDNKNHYDSFAYKKDLLAGFMARGNAFVALGDLFHGEALNECYQHALEDYRSILALNTTAVITDKIEQVKVAIAVNTFVGDFNQYPQTTLDNFKGSLFKNSSAFMERLNHLADTGKISRDVVQTFAEASRITPTKEDFKAKVGSYFQFK